MASKVAICNLALSRLGAARVTALSENSKEAKDCNAIFDLIAEEVMAMGAWPSATRRATLAQLSTTPEFEFTYTYQLPTDPKFLRILSINDSKRGDIPYAIEGDKLLTNESSLKLRYVANITDPETYDIYLRQAIVDRLVAELTYAVTGQGSMYKAALSYHIEHAQELLALASLGSETAQEINSDTFIDCRGGGFPDEGRPRD